MHFINALITFLTMLGLASTIAANPIAALSNDNSTLVHLEERKLRDGTTKQRPIWSGKPGKIYITAPPYQSPTVRRTPNCLQDGIYPCYRKCVQDRVTRMVLDRTIRFLPDTDFELYWKDSAGGSANTPFTRITQIITQLGCSIDCEDRGFYKTRRCIQDSDHDYQGWVAAMVQYGWEVSLGIKPNKWYPAYG